MTTPEPVEQAAEVRGIIQQNLYTMNHAKRAGNLIGQILSACLADEVGREPLDREVVAKAAHDAAEAAMRAYMNARETGKRAAALRDAGLLGDGAALERHRDLTRRLGFGDNVTEPQADNDTIVAWFDEQGRDASEWHESQQWRNDCAAAGHPDDEDCPEHDPALRLLIAEAALERVRGLAAKWEAKAASNEKGGYYAWAMWQTRANELRAALGDQR